MKQMIVNLFMACTSFLAVIAVCTLVFGFGFVEFNKVNAQAVETSAGK